MDEQIDELKAFISDLSATAVNLDRANTPQSLAARLRAIVALSDSISDQAHAILDMRSFHMPAENQPNA